MKLFNKSTKPIASYFNKSGPPRNGLFTKLYNGKAKTNHSSINDDQKLKQSPLER